MRLTPLLLMQRGFDRARLHRARQFNNAWQRTRLRDVTNQKVAERLEEKGFVVHNAEDVITTSYLPEMPKYSEDELNDDPKLPELELAKDSPFYHEEIVFSFLEKSAFPMDNQLAHAKALFKAVEIHPGLPERLLSRMNRYSDIVNNERERLADVVRETQMADATQKRLPKPIHPPYIGWHPVESTMFRKMPYEVKFSYGYGIGYPYGVPMGRKNSHLVRGLFGLCDQLLGVGNPALLSRYTEIDANVRQFGERYDKRFRLYLKVPFLVTDSQRVLPFASAEEVEATKAIPMDDLYPMNPFARLERSRVYRDENSYPILCKNSHSAPHTCMVVSLYNNAESRKKEDSYAAKSLAHAFNVALGEARLLYGSNIKGVLPEPIVVQHVLTEGKKFFFSVLQLNTLDLKDDEGIKNIFWCDQELRPLFDQCDYVKAVPTLEGLNEEVFQLFAAMYLENIDK